MPKELWYDSSRKSDFTYNKPQPYNKIGDGPEGPEVSILAENLNAILDNCKIMKIKIIGGRFVKNKPKGYDEFQKELPVKIYKVSNRGKFLYFNVSNNKGKYAIWNTLGLTGKWLFDKEKHSAIEFTFKRLKTPRKIIHKKIVTPTGVTLSSTTRPANLPYYSPIYELIVPDSVVQNTTFKMYYTDVRRFGTFSFTNIAELNKKLRTLKYDILKDDITFKDFKCEFEKRVGKKGKSREITKVLMDAKLFTNIGNYIKCEALYLAKISPKRTIDKLSNSDLKNLLKAIRYILKLSYKSQHGINNYLPNVNTINNQFKFLVYKQKEDPLGNKVERFESSDKRSTYWVPAVQV